MVIIQTYPDVEKPSQGLRTFPVDLKNPGVTRGDLHGKLDVRAGSTGWISFQDKKVPARNRFGEEGERYIFSMSVFENGRCTVGAGATGLIRATLQASVAHAKERLSFCMFIAEHQLIKSKITQMA